MPSMCEFNWLFLVQKTNIGYTLRCKVCKDYEGESCRNMHLRGKEHIQQLKNKDKNSVLLKHVEEDDKEDKENVEFEMVMTKSFKTLES